MKGGIMPNMKTPEKKEVGRLRIVSLGGVDEIGKNMYAAVCTSV